MTRSLPDFITTALTLLGVSLCMISSSFMDKPTVQVPEETHQSYAQTEVHIDTPATYSPHNVSARCVESQTKGTSPQEYCCMPEEAYANHDCVGTLKCPAYPEEEALCAGVHDSRMLKVACDEGDGRSCARLGFLHIKGYDVRMDYEAALMLYRKACDANMLDSCVAAGDLYQIRYEHGSTSQNHRDAFKLYARACRARDIRGCSRLGDMYDRGQGVKKNEARALKLFEQACAGEDAHACSILGDKASIHEEYDPHNASDRDYILRLYEKACNLKNMEACISQVLLWSADKTRAQHDEFATPIYTKACDGGDRLGCYELGLIVYAYGQSTKDAQEHAADLFMKSCEEPVFMSGCHKLGYMYHAGFRIRENDEARAAEFYKMICAAGYILPVAWQHEC